MRIEHDEARLRRQLVVAPAPTSRPPRSTITQHGHDPPAVRSRGLRYCDRSEGDHTPWPVRPTICYQHGLMTYTDGTPERALRRIEQPVVPSTARSPLRRAIERASFPGGTPSGRGRADVVRSTLGQKRGVVESSPGRCHRVETRTRVRSLDAGQVALAGAGDQKRRRRRTARAAGQRRGTHVDRRSHRVRVGVAARVRTNAAPSDVCSRALSRRSSPRRSIATATPSGRAHSRTPTRR